MYSKKVLRHFKKSFGSSEIDVVLERIEDVLKRLPEEMGKELGPLTGLRQFVDSTNRAYTEYEDRLLMADRNIDISSSELSNMNRRLAKVNTAINTMIDSLGEGYFLVNSEGVCEGIYSRVCESIFGGSPSGVPLADLLNIDGEDRETLTQWLYLTFSGRLPLEDVVELGPSEFKSKKGQFFNLAFRMIMSGDEVQNLVVVASDKTAEIKANALAEDKVLEARTIVKLVEDKGQFQDFFKTAKETLNFLSSLRDPVDWHQVRFEMHTLKGGAAAFYMKDTEQLLHDLEVRIKQSLERNEKCSVKLSSAIREIENSFEGFISRFQRVLGNKESWLNQIVFNKNEFLKFLFKEREDRFPQEFVEDVLSQVMGVDIGEAFASYRSTVQVTAQRLSKKTNPLLIQGDKLRLPGEPYRKMFASLVHLFRNAVDHGIESEDQRMGAGKPPQGTITVRFGLVNTKSWWFEVEDDGGGIDCVALRERLVEREGPAARNISDDEILKSLLRLSLSSKTSVDQTSGMGVGLAAVGSAVEELGGKYSVRSRLGKGTLFHFEIPIISWCDFLNSQSLAA